jgi:hypothetical protein
LQGGEIALGFSGAPCVSEGSAVGFIRTAFSRAQHRTNAGTLYATSMEDVAKVVLPILRKSDQPELRELKSRFDRVHAIPAISWLGRAAGVALVFCTAWLLGTSRLNVELRDSNHRPAERVHVELDDCVLGRRERSSNERGALSFVVFRWCPRHALVLENYGRSGQPPLHLKKWSFLRISEVTCKILDGRSMDCN